MSNVSTNKSVSRNPSTVAVRAGIDRDSAFGAVTPPLVLSSNFSFAGFNQKRQYDYTRSGNPTRDLLGEALAELEGGAGGVVTATGMASPTPAACDSTMFRCNVSRSCASMRTFANFPKPVLMP